MSLEFSEISRVVDERLRALCPITRIQMRKQGDAMVVAFTPDVSATPEQIATANAFVANIDWSESAALDYKRDKEPALRDMLAAASNAIASIDTFLALPTPTNAQIVAEVKASAQQRKGIIQALVRIVQKVQG